MCSFIENYKINKALKKKQREKRIEQACCPHHIVYIGTYDEYYADGFNRRTRTVYQAYCPICDQNFYYNHKITLDIELEKQKVKESFQAQ